MNVLEGERFEQRRILHEGRPEWTTVDGEEPVSYTHLRAHETS